MRPLGLAAILSCLAVSLAPACKDAQRQELETRARSANSLVAQGRQELARGKYEKAATSFKEAISATPDDTNLYVLLADAYRQAGNEAGAVLTLKQAEQVGGKDDPSLKRARADLYLRMHKVPAAISELLALRDAELLTDAEILELAKLQAYANRVDDAFKTLDLVLKRAPDDPEAKTVEAEIMLVRGDELLAAQRMDKLIEDNPALTSARLLRARYFLSNDHTDLAEKDLGMINGEDARRGDVVTLRATVLNTLKRYDEAAGILQPLVDENPKDAELIALLAENRLAQGKAQEAAVMVDRALTLQPKFARALWVRGEALAQQGNSDAARTDFEAARASNPEFVPAYRSLWRIADSHGEKLEAMVALENVRRLGDLRPAERLALATLYTDTGSSLDRAKQLVEEVLKKDPASAEAKKLKARLTKQTKPKQPGIIIMRHR